VKWPQSLIETSHPLRTLCDEWCAAHHIALHALHALHDLRAVRAFSDLVSRHEFGIRDGRLREMLELS